MLLTYKYFTKLNSEKYHWSTNQLLNSLRSIFNAMHDFI